MAAFSYYFERAIESGLIDPFQGGEITVSAYRKKAEEICSIANDEQPFMCFDLTFISVLLREGYGLGDSKKIKVILNKLDFLYYLNNNVSFLICSFIKKSMDMKFHGRWAVRTMF